MLSLVRFYKGETVDLKNCFSDDEIKSLNEKKILSLRGKKEFQS